MANRKRRRTQDHNSNDGVGVSKNGVTTKTITQTANKKNNKANQMPTKRKNGDERKNKTTPNHHQQQLIHKKSLSNDNSQKNMDNWVADLAKQASSSDAIVTSSNKKQKTSAPQVAVIANKAERMEKRTAKKMQRQERQQQKMTASIKHTSSNRADPKVADQCKHMEKEAINRKRPATTITSNTGLGITTTSAISIKRLKTLAITCQHILHQQRKDTFKVGKQGPYRVAPKPFEGFATTAAAHKRNHRRIKQWNDDTIQPRPRDYGGLGLALPSLWLPFEDPSFLARLTTEFQEHIDGFYGKQRTKAMKKQLDGNMLWRQISRLKNNPKAQEPQLVLQPHNNQGAKTKKGKKQQQQQQSGKQVVSAKKLAAMAPDERVEAMLKAGML